MLLLLTLWSLLLLFIVGDGTCRKCPCIGRAAGPAPRKVRRDHFWKWVPLFSRWFWPATFVPALCEHIPIAFRYRSIVPDSHLPIAHLPHSRWSWAVNSYRRWFPTLLMGAIRPWVFSRFLQFCWVPRFSCCHRFPICVFHIPRCIWWWWGHDFLRTVFISPSVLISWESAPHVLLTIDSLVFPAISQVSFLHRFRLPRFLCLGATATTTFWFLPRHAPGSAIQVCHYRRFGLPPLALLLTPAFHHYVYHVHHLLLLHTPPRHHTTPRNNNGLWFWPHTRVLYTCCVNDRVSGFTSACTPHALMTVVHMQRHHRRAHHCTHILLHSMPHAHMGS